jgi:hypothetical protein
MLQGRQGAAQVRQEALRGVHGGAWWVNMLRHVVGMCDGGVAWFQAHDLGQCGQEARRATTWRCVMVIHVMLKAQGCMT